MYQRQCAAGRRRKKRSKRGNTKAEMLLDLSLIIRHSYIRENARGANSVIDIYRME